MEYSAAATKRLSQLAFLPSKKHKKYSEAHSLYIKAAQTCIQQAQGQQTPTSILNTSSSSTTRATRSNSLYSYSQSNDLLIHAAESYTCAASLAFRKLHLAALACSSYLEACLCYMAAQEWEAAYEVLKKGIEVRELLGLQRSPHSPQHPHFTSSQPAASPSSKVSAVSSSKRHSITYRVPIVGRPSRRSSDAGPFRDKKPSSSTPSSPQFTATHGTATGSSNIPPLITTTASANTNNPVKSSVLSKMKQLMVRTDKQKDKKNGLAINYPDNNTTNHHTQTQTGHKHTAAGDLSPLHLPHALSPMPSSPVRSPSASAPPSPQHLAVAQPVASPVHTTTNHHSHNSHTLTPHYSPNKAQSQKHHHYQQQPLPSSASYSHSPPLPTSSPLLAVQATLYETLNDDTLALPALSVVVSPSSTSTSLSTPISSSIISPLPSALTLGRVPSSESALLSLSMTFQLSSLAQQLGYALWDDGAYKTSLECLERALAFLVVLDNTYILSANKHLPSSTLLATAATRIQLCYHLAGYYLSYHQHVLDDRPSYECEPKLLTRARELYTQVVIHSTKKQSPHHHTPKQHAHHPHQSPHQHPHPHPHLQHQQTLSPQAAQLLTDDEPGYTLLSQCLCEHGLMDAALVNLIMSYTVPSLITALTAACLCDALNAGSSNGFYNRILLTPAPLLSALSLYPPFLHSAECKFVRQCFGFLQLSCSPPVRLQDNSSSSNTSNTTASTSASGGGSSSSSSTSSMSSSLSNPDEQYRRVMLAVWGNEINNEFLTALALFIRRKQQQSSHHIARRSSTSTTITITPATTSNSQPSFLSMLLPQATDPLESTSLDDLSALDDMLIPLILKVKKIIHHHTTLPNSTSTSSSTSSSSTGAAGSWQNSKAAH